MEEIAIAEIDVLTGSFLISTPHMPDPRFSKQVIYICSHGHDGAIGIAINKPNPQLKLEEVLISNQLPVPESLNSVIHIGGPVEPQSAFILYPSNYVADEQLEVSSSVYLSRHTE